MARDRSLRAERRCAILRRGKGSAMRARKVTVAAFVAGTLAAIASTGEGVAAPRLPAGYKGVPRPRTIHGSEARGSMFARTTLYDQMGLDRGTGVNSQNYESQYDAYDD